MQPAHPASFLFQAHALSKDTKNFVSSVEANLNTHTHTRKFGNLFLLNNHTSFRCKLGQYDEIYSVRACPKLKFQNVHNSYL